MAFADANTRASNTRAPYSSGLPTWRAVGASIGALLLAACGGSARDADGVPELRDEGNRVPDVFEFPEGGRTFDGASGLLSPNFAADHTGALWFLGCGGLFVLNDRQARFYDRTLSAFPERMSGLIVDANNRKWIASSAGDSGVSTLGVFEHGQFRPVLTSPDLVQVASSANGVVWAYYSAGNPPEAFVRQVAPTLGEPLPLPDDPQMLYGGQTDQDGAMWLRALDTDDSLTGYRWSNGVWSAPFAMPDTDLQYSAEQDVLWSYAGELDHDIRRVSWAGDHMDERIERGLADEEASFAGFVGGERQVWSDDDQLLWVEDGVVRDRQTMPGTVWSARVSWGGAIYVFTETALYRWHAGELTEVVDLDFSGRCR